MSLTSKEIEKIKEKPCDILRFIKFFVPDAEKYALIASKADKTWGEPDFILGWQALVFGAGNAEEHLIHAIEKDKRMLFRIANDDICKKYPHIIKKLKAKYSAISDE